MTILDMLISNYKDNTLITRSLDIIKSDFTNLVNDNYELTINEKGDLVVKIPSLEKRDEFVYKSVTDYEYPLVMCMRVTATKNPEKYGFMLGKFMELYKDKLELFFKDVKTVDTLMEKIKRTKNNIDYATYSSSSAIFNIFSRVVSLTFKVSSKFKTLETVAMETSAIDAISFIVAKIICPPSVIIFKLVKNKESIS